MCTDTFRIPAVTLAVVSLLAPSLTAESRETPWIAVGAAKTDITPDFPVLLAGYGGRTKESEGIDERIWTRALAIGRDDPAILIAVDNCGVPRGVVKRVAARLKKAQAVKRARLVVSSTHTHCAPTLTGYAPVVWAERATKEQLERVERYTGWLEDRLVGVATKALAARIECRLEWAQGRVSFGGNRRVLNADRSWRGFGFQVNGPVDHGLPILIATGKNGEIAAVWTSYACHCTTLGARNHISGDWAGFTNGALEEDHPGAVALTTIGCGANVGPQPSGNAGAAKQHGRSIANEVARLLKTKLTPLIEPPRSTVRQLKLPFAKTPDRSHWEGRKTDGGFHGVHARRQLARLERDGSLPEHLEYSITTWTFGDDLAIVFLPGEVVVDYSVRLKRELDWRRLWINGWSNDVPGYIPSRRILDEGGYEPDFSQIYYDHPGRFAPEVEDLIVGSVKGALGKPFAAEKGSEGAPYHRHPGLDGGPLEPPPQLKDADIERIQQHIKGTANAERLLERIAVAQNGFAKTVDFAGEFASWFDFTGGRRFRPFIRQDKRDRVLAWMTPELEAKRPECTIVFVGGVGWSSEPETKGFVLDVNGRATIDFDVALEPKRWTDAPGAAELLYLPTWTSNVDSAGFFYLTVPSDWVRGAKGNRCSITVRSNGGGSRRWFAIDRIVDTVKYQAVLSEGLKR